MLTTQRSSAWTKPGGAAGNLESELARSNDLKSQFEAIKLALRDSENRVEEFLTSNGFGGGIVAGATMTAELNTADLHQLLRETQHDVLRPSSPESKTGDFGSGHDDDVEVQKAVDLAAQTEKMLSMAAASKKLAAEKLLLARQKKQDERKVRKGKLSNFCFVLATPKNVNTMSSW